MQNDFLHRKLSFEPFLHSLAEDYRDIIVDHNKLEEVKHSTASIIELEENRKRIRNRIARENTTYNKALERINHANDFVDVSTLLKILNISKSVCRILYNGKAVGTGFLISGNVVLTNHHVIPDENYGSFCEVQFNYETGIDGKMQQNTKFKLDPASFFVSSTLDTDPDNKLSGLDFTMIAVEAENEEKSKISDFAALELDGNFGKIIKGESIIIIQHPGGLPKKTTLNNNSFFSESKDLLIYETDTLPGSSGSLVLALGTCEVIALHQKGIPKQDENGNVLTKDGRIADSNTPDEEIDWLGNAGIKISRILETLDKMPLSGLQNDIKEKILARTKENKKVLSDNAPKKIPAQPKKDTAKEKEEQKPVNMGKNAFLILMKNSEKVIREFQKTVSEKYGPYFEFALAMQITAIEDQQELFVLKINTGRQNPNDVAQELQKIKNVKHAEYDSELLLNTTIENEKTIAITESLGSKDDGSEKYFTDLYGKTSSYVKDFTSDEFRKWAWKAIGYSGSVKDIIGNSVKLVQFDTGYVVHPKIIGAFDFENDFDFVSDDRDAHEDINKSFSVADFGHGGRTGSIIGGNPTAVLQNNMNGNAGLLYQNKVKIIPFRVAKDVIILGRQAELAKAVDAAIAMGAKIITTSMGLPPTLTTFQLAKKAYENGVIWVCAAGNEVGEVVAPAVHEGTIAVAASNPMDSEWKGSSRGKEVDITAPGMHIYVPRFEKKGVFSMSYGHGTSYATPHVASAAVLWYHVNREKLSAYHGFEIVEAFRYSLKKSARKSSSLPQGFGAGILNIDALLKVPLPPKSTLQNAYKNVKIDAVAAKFRTVTESIKMIWNGLMRTKRKVFNGEESLMLNEKISDHAQETLAKLQTSPQEVVNNLSEEQQLEKYNQLRKLVL